MKNRNAMRKTHAETGCVNEALETKKKFELPELVTFLIYKRIRGCEIFIIEFHTKI